MHYFSISVFSPLYTFIIHENRSMMSPADPAAGFTGERDAGGAWGGGEAEEMMNLLITQSLTEGATASSFIDPHTLRG